MERTCSDAEEIRKKVEEDLFNLSYFLYGLGLVGEFSVTSSTVVKIRNCAYAWEQK